MIIAFIIAVAAAVTFFLLWQEEKEKLAEAQKQIKQLKRKKLPSKKKTEPVTIEKSKGNREYVIKKPQPPVPKPLLDPKKLAELQEQTRTAQGMLADIFIQEEEPVKDMVAVSDNKHMLDILAVLLAKEVWTRGEVAEIAGPDVMIGNLLEQINEYSCSKIDDIVLEEEGDKIYVTTEYKDQLI